MMKVAIIFSFCLFQIQLLGLEFGCSITSWVGIVVPKLVKLLKRPPPPSDALGKKTDFCRFSPEPVRRLPSNRLARKKQEIG